MGAGTKFVQRVKVFGCGALEVSCENNDKSVCLLI